jgi:hypothetical protein
MSSTMPKLDDIRVYRRVLTGPEVAILATP